MLEWVPRDVRIPIHYWGFGIGIGGIDRYWYLSVLVLVLCDIPIPNAIRISIYYSGFSH